MKGRKFKSILTIFMAFIMVIGFAPGKVRASGEKPKECGATLSNFGLTFVPDPKTGKKVPTFILTQKEGVWGKVKGDSNQRSRWRRLPDGRIEIEYETNLTKKGGENVPTGKVNNASFGQEMVGKVEGSNISNKDQHDLAVQIDNTKGNALLKGKQEVEIIKNEYSQKDHIRIRGKITFDGELPKETKISESTSRVIVAKDFLTFAHDSGKDLTKMSDNEVNRELQEYLKKDKRVTTDSRPSTFFRMRPEVSAEFMRRNYHKKYKNPFVDEKRYDRGDSRYLKYQRDYYNGIIERYGKKIANDIMERLNIWDSEETLHDITDEHEGRTVNMGIGVLINVPCPDKDPTPKKPPHTEIPPSTPTGGEGCGDKYRYEIKKDKYYLYSTYPKEIIESAPYVNKTFCPDVDNEGWYFWNEKPYGTQLGYSDGGQKGGFLSYMEKDGKGDDLPNSPAKTNAFSTYFEYQPFYEGMDPNDGEAVARKLDSDNKVITGLPTYDRWQPGFEDKYSPDGSAGYGMTKLVKGWYTKDHFDRYRIETNNDGVPYGRNEGKYNYPYNKGWNAIHESEHPQVIEDFKGSNGESRMFKGTPKGRFTVTWLEPQLGYNKDGSPKWAVGTNITRRCQEKFDTLVKYGRKIFEDQVFQHYEDYYKIYLHTWRWEPHFRQVWNPYHHKEWYKDCYWFGEQYICENKFYWVGEYEWEGDWVCDGPESRPYYSHRVLKERKGECSGVINGATGEMYIPDELQSKGCIYQGTQAPIYEEGREWNYRKYLDTEYKGYIVPNGGDDPTDPGKHNPGDPDPNGGDPPGNTLIPYVGDRENIKDKDKKKYKDTTKPGRNIIKSGYGVTYNADVKIYSDWGKREDNPKIAVVDKKMARDIGNYNNVNNNMYSQLIRPGKTTRLPVNKKNINSDDIWTNKILPNTKDNIEVTSRVKNPYRVYGPSGSSAPDSDFIRDELGLVKDGVDVRDVRPRDILVDKVTNNSNKTPVEGGEYKWKQKSGMGIEYGSKKGYFHAYRETKLNNNLVPALDRSRQHFIHVDYGNGPYSVGSLVEIQMFKNPSRAQKEFGINKIDKSGKVETIRLKQTPVNIEGDNLIPTVRARMGNYASITVKGNMYEDTYTAPDNPYLGGRFGGK